MCFTLTLYTAILRCSSPIDFTCCTDVTRPCIANLTAPDQNSEFQYDKDLDTMTPRTCNSNGANCCTVVPWPEGIMYGYPYRLRTPADEDMEVSFTSHM